MKTILVAGGAGEVGEGIVRQLLARGYKVLVQSRTEDRVEALRSRLENPSHLISAIGDVNDEGQVSTLKDSIRDAGHTLDAVVDSIGSWWSGPTLVDLDLATFNAVIHERLTIHFLLAKAFLHDLQDRQGASYVFIHSAAGYVAIPHSGPVSIAGAAQVMLKDVFAKELEDAAVRINLLSMMGSIATRSHPSDDPEALTNDDVGNYVSYLVEDDSLGVRGQTIRFSHRRELPK